jgi:hypothetical protein
MHIMNSRDTGQQSVLHWFKAQTTKLGEVSTARFDMVFAVFLKALR